MITYKRKFIIPDTFESDLKAVLSENPPPDGFNIDHAYLLVHYIISLPKFNEKYLTSDGYTLLMYKYLRKNGISKPALIKGYLERTGLIQCDNNFRKWDKEKKIDGKPFGYKMAEKYKWQYKSIECNDAALNTAYNSDRQYMEFNYNITHPHLVKHFSVVSIDYQGIEIEMYARLVEDNMVGSSKKNKKQKWSMADFTTNAEHKFGAAYSVLERLRNKDLFYKIDENGKRFHTNFTSMPGFFRKYITVNGKRLIGLDIANSQPFFSTILFTKEFWISEKIKKAKFSFNILKSYNQTLYNNIKSNILPLMTTKLIQSFDNKDVKDFIELAQTGKFYQHLKELIENHSDPKINCYSTIVKDYSTLKEMIFIVMFSSNKFINRPSTNGFQGSELKDLFKQLFPTVYKIFASIKSHKKETLALLLQNIESYAIIEKVTRRIAKERPGLFILTIHDSIITTEGDEEYLRTVMEEELTKLIGFPPKLKLDKWFDEYSDLDSPFTLSELKEMVYKIAA